MIIKIRAYTTKSHKKTSDTPRKGVEFICSPKDPNFPTPRTTKFNFLHPCVTNGHTNEMSDVTS